MSADNVARELGRLPELVNANAPLVRRGRTFSGEFLVQADEVPVHVKVAEGRIISVETGPFRMRAWRFAIKAEASAWARHWEAVPVPGYHDVIAMTRLGVARLEGDLHPLMAHLRYIKEVLAAPRDMAIQYEPMIGRYATMSIGGRDCRVYMEEAGQGIPLLCLHTAGSDGRQYRHMMSDPAITEHFRVIAFDLPWHGKSNPPVGFEDEEYRLTTDVYTDAILTVSKALELDRPIVTGCSMGGRIVLHLAAHHADAFRALIGVESADHQTSWYDTSWLHRGDVHGGEICAAMVSGLVAPQSPDEYRWETLWGYMQSGPGVFKGDLHFYREDSDFRDRTHLIDTAACPLYLLTGEYDYSCTPEDTLRTAEAIDGAQAVIMAEVGHFPMSENPDKFRDYLIPVLDDIRARQSA
jgi:pimeloyl-ACP methyl ester carboxylesterase